MQLTAVLVTGLVRLSEDKLIKGPKPEDVKAGYLALFIFLGLIAAVVLLGFSLVKQLRKAQAAKDAGLYGDEPAAEEQRHSTAD